MKAEKNSQPDGPGARCSDCGADARRHDGDALRGECGSLLARYLAGRIELKCRRCKRTVTVPVESAPGVTR
jgi:hypothetical protein